MTDNGISKTFKTNIVNMLRDLKENIMRREIENIKKNPNETISNRKYNIRNDKLTR